MISPLLQGTIVYGGAVILGLILGLILKASFARQLQDKLRSYQLEIVNCYEVILRLESEKDQLQKRISELEAGFFRDQAISN